MKYTCSMETVQQNGRFTLFSIKFLSIYSILYGSIMNWTCHSLIGRSIEITLTVSLMKIFMNKSHVFKTKSNSKFSLKFWENKDNKIQPFDNFLSGWYSSGSFHLSKCFLVQYRHFINLQEEIIQTMRHERYIYVDVTCEL